jgi:hypothetical protein
MGKIKFNRELTDTVDHLFRMGNQDPSLEQIIHEHSGVDSFQNMDEIREEYRGALPDVKSHLADEWPSVHSVTKAWYASRDTGAPWRERDPHSLNLWQLKASVAGIAPVFNETYGLRRATVSDDPLQQMSMYRKASQNAGGLNELQDRLERSRQKGLVTEDTVNEVTKAAREKLDVNQLGMFDESRKQIEAA